MQGRRQDKRNKEVGNTLYLYLLIVLNEIPWPRLCKKCARKKMRQDKKKREEQKNYPKNEERSSLFTCFATSFTTIIIKWRSCHNMSI